MHNGGIKEETPCNVHRVFIQSVHHTIRITRIHTSLQKTEFKITQILVDERRIVVVSMHGVSVVLLLYLSSVHVNKDCNSSLLLIVIS